MQEPEAQVRRARDVEITPRDPGPSVSKVSPTMDSDMFAEGWCRIVEEPPDEYLLLFGLVFLLRDPLNWACFFLYYCAGPLFYF